MSSALHLPELCTDAYPERRDPKLSRLDEAGTRAAGAVLRRLRSRRRRMYDAVARVAALEPAMQDLADDQIRPLAGELRRALHRRGLDDDELVARSFALVREVARRRLGQRHYDVQVMGGWVLLSGMVTEMETGEGKTLTATLPACTAALAGMPTHIVTVNDYLVGRDAEQMGEVYQTLGLSCGAVREGMDPDSKRKQYACDVTYCTNKDLAFDYLRDRITLGAVRSRARLQIERLAHGRSRESRLLLRGLHFAIVDEADSVLVDEARTPLIISAGGETDEAEEQIYRTAVALALELDPGSDFTTNPRERRAKVTPAGEERLAGLAKPLDGIWTGPLRRKEFVSQALTALYLFEKDRHYLLHDGKVQIIDEYTGRTMPDRTWQRGLHQMIEVKEGCAITGHAEPVAQISYQRFFRRYLRLAGMTGTVSEVAGELWSVYRLPVARVPTNRPVQRRSLGARVHTSAEARWQDVVASIQAMHDAGRPVLVGTRSVGASEHLSRLLDEAVLPHRVLNARQDQEEAEIVAQAGEWGRITVATNMAGRGTDIRLMPESAEAGGLHVIVTERHESQRIDRQLLGRCGRQGDPGSYEVIVSLEDELVDTHGRGFARVARAMGQADGPLSPRLRRLTVRLAQRRAERVYAGIRRALLRMDERVETQLAFSGRGE